MINNIIKIVLICCFSLLTIPASADTNKVATKYPIILIHGLFGFDDIWGIDYFYGIPQALTEKGNIVFIAAVSPSNKTEVRGEQLRTYVQSVMVLTGAKKVNLIGHSHGAPTARYVASVSPEWVASVTSVGGVNWGSHFADYLRGNISPHSNSEWLIEQGLNSLADLIARLSGHKERPNDTLTMADSLTTAGSIKFNQTYPEGIPSQYCGETDMLASNGVYYFSWSGTSVMTNYLDAIDYSLALTSLIFDEENDGLVSRCSSHLGKVIKDNYKMNHLDEINQSFGLVSWWETNPINLYLQHAQRLRELGL
ncbi:triacylglycerol lipase [uncultured Shewanella sp.]|uniref:esterase/lipase family protein n=1 Tax=uncultured Shewanella sp. TaxID=173975 RepID=UPI00262E7017|nr:triacylglycerol lipase [uncultured Shewanella sp.]